MGLPARDLRIPQGTEAFYLEEAYVHRRLVRTFEDVCDSWAYFPVHTPVYDYYEAYRDLVDHEWDSQSYRLVDRSGELLVLRSDVTLFLARQMGLVLRHEDLPIRVAYSDTILRHEELHDLSKNEFFQVGAELIGPSGADADAESILLLFDALDRWGAADVVVHVGHRGIIGEAGDTARLAEAVSHRRWDAVDQLLANRSIEAPRRAELVELFGFIGTEAELDGLAGRLRHLTPREVDAVAHLRHIYRVCSDLGYTNRVRIDLSEAGSRHYHSGIVFQAYAPGASAAIASGGRYDGLLSHFGFDAPSVGFSVMLRRLQALLHTPDGLPVVATPSDADIVTRARAARDMRRDGKVASL
ncbi:MAG: ATP phosphoribosyltransferase regulatory subunit [Spirochaetaceae bacterium]|nr:MAG: ATP phosphoribosyltransferase regulatory subunit [Spirochaetaceae bacterium]